MFRNYIKVLFTNLWVVCIGLINSFVFPLLLTVEGYAEYQVFLLYISYIGILHLGFSDGMFINYGGVSYKTIDKRQYKSELIILYGILLFFSVISLAIYAVLRQTIFLYMTLTILPVCIINTYKLLYPAWGMFNKFSVLAVSINTATTAFALGYYFIFHRLNATVLIISYLAVNLFVTFVIFMSENRFIRSVKTAPLYSRYNTQTLKNGFMLAIGNYINTWLISIDKSFINFSFSKKEYGVYAFAVSMLGMMSIFISAIAQPLYPQIASQNISRKDLANVREMLLVFGSYSGCAYFACSIIVSHFLKQYVESLSIVAVLFAAFPAMAVVSVLYINLYKVTKQTFRYIKTLLLVLSISVLFNLIIVFFFKNFRYVAVVTNITYYFWLFYSCRHFSFLQVKKRELVYLSGFMLLYLTFTHIPNAWMGFFCYLFGITVWAFCIFRRRIRNYIAILKK